MVRIRKLDELLVKAFYDKKFSRYHSQQGQEAVGVGVCTFLRKDDYLYYTHRGHGLGELVSKGFSPKAFVAEHYGKATGGSNGIGLVNMCDPEMGFFGMGGTVGGELTLAAGTGISAKLRGKGQVVASFMGDGTTGRGTLHESMLMTANWKLPVLWLCSNNKIAMWVPTEVTYPKENFADLAFGYGIPAAIVDGQDVIAVYEAAQTAIKRARAGEGPSFIEFKTCRYRSQMEGAADICQDGLRSEEEINAWKERDPIDLFQDKLLKEGILTRADVERIDREALKEAEEAERFAEESPYPAPDILGKALYSD